MGKQTKDGRLAAPNTANRTRMVLHNVFEFVREIGVLDENPLKPVRLARPRTLSTVEPATVIDPEQAHRYLAAVEAHSERGRRLKASSPACTTQRFVQRRYPNCGGPISSTCRASQGVGVNPPHQLGPKIG